MFRIFLLFGLLAVHATSAHADTTWVAAGTISGNWTAAGSPYMIQGNDTVATGTSLDIGPGVTVFFAGAHRIVVNGLLRAVGTASDSIYFTTDTLTYPDRWRGLHFQSADTACVLDYCVIEHGRAVGTGEDRYGGGIECQTSRPTISHCRIRNCFASIDGAGIYCQILSAPVITDCEIYNNSTQFGGGAGMMCRQSNPVLTNCVIHHNRTPLNGAGLFFTYTSHPVLTNCVIRNNAAGIGGGVYCTGALTVARLTNCLVAANTATFSGGGVSTVNSSAQLFGCLISSNTAVNGGGISDSTLGSLLENCLLISNIASGNGGGVHSGNGAQTQIRHCTLSGNGASSGGNLYFVGSAATLANSIAAFATGGAGVAVTSSPALAIWNSDFFGNIGGDLTGDVPGNVGVVDTTNLNGDPCDRSENIFLDPQFFDAANGDYHLTDGSACISAARGSAVNLDYDGNPRPNPDDTQPDIGAFESVLGGSLYACGALSGEIGPGDVMVPCDISVETGDTLVIAPGTRFLFMGRSSFTVRGLLRAMGTETDSITFTRSGETDWRGLRFISCHDSTVLSYVNVEHARGEGYSAPEGNGGIYCSNADLRVDHSRIRYNQSTYRGGGVACYANSSPVFVACVIRENRAEGPLFIFGGGVYTSESAPRFEGCAIDSNTASHRGGGVYVENSSLVLNDCLLRNNTSVDGGGLYADGAAPGLANCIIEENSASASGGGMFLHSHAVVNDCRIQNNQAGENGGGVYCDFYDPVLNHCVLTGNTAQNQGGAYYARTSAPVMKRCTLVGNSAPTGGQIYLFSTTALINSSILASTSTAAMYFQASNGAMVRYCDFSGNPNGHFGYFNNDPGQGPANLGALNRVNVNGDSSDTYYNIFLDPQFVDMQGGDFHLQNGSPCIQAGDPALPHDPDGSVADIGAFYAGPPPGPPLPFDLLLPDDGDTLSTPVVQFCWQAARDPDPGDTVRYTLHFVTEGGTTFLRPVGVDTCDDIPEAALPFEDSVEVAWWVEAHSLFPDTTTHSISTRTFFWAPPGQSTDERATGVPHAFALRANYPNPFNASTVIGFDLPVASAVRLEVFDVLGRVVATLVDETRPAGSYRTVFDASQLGSGVYLTRLTAGHFVSTRKLVVVK